MPNKYTYSTVPEYERFATMQSLASLASRLAHQVINTTRNFLPAKVEELDIIDVGCGYGHTSIELARTCRSVVGVEPSQPLFEGACDSLGHSGLSNVVFKNESVYNISTNSTYDLAVLDNVFEHLPDQPNALRIITNILRPGGVLFLLTPNKLWPIEAHYHLPFLSYLPLRWANFYLRAMRRGVDYSDASYAPNYWQLRRLLNEIPEFSYYFVVPSDLSATIAGAPWHYRVGAAAIRRMPFLWAISKSFVVVAVKDRLVATTINVNPA